jgi:uncharacterized protein YndB with AHSA1/START domain/GNAT superfamily N-acetyltransferase
VKPFETAVEIGVPPAAVWEALVAPDAHRTWYYDLAPDGRFAEGAAIRWRQRDGTLAEDSRVREVTPLRRLVLETRFTFAPAFAAAPPHIMRFEIEPAGAGSRVVMRVDFAAAGPVQRLFESEGAGLLKGLRVALDPAVRAQLARLDRIGAVEIHDVTAERVADYQAFFDEDAFRDYPAWSTCYCMETHFGGSQEEHLLRNAADNRADMSRLLASGEATALLAYADGRPVAWCSYGASTRLAGVMAKLKLEPADHQGVGSIACFVIAAPYRGHGLARRLLDAACERLAACGLEWVEAYPQRAAGSAQANYRGPLEMYRAAGFQPYREAERTLVVRKRLRDG